MLQRNHLVAIAVFQLFQEVFTPWITCRGIAQRHEPEAAIRARSSPMDKHEQRTGPDEILRGKYRAIGVELGIRGPPPYPGRLHEPFIELDSERLAREGSHGGAQRVWEIEIKGPHGFDDACPTCASRRRARKDHWQINGVRLNDAP